MKVGIKFKLISFTATLLLVVISLLSFFVLNGIKEYQQKEVEATLLKQKDMFEQYYSEQSNLNESGNSDLPTIGRGNIFNKPWLRTIPAIVYNIKGELLSGFKTDANVDENKDKQVMIQYAIEGKVSYTQINNIIYFYSPIKYKDEIVGILELQYSIESSSLFYNNVKKMSYGTGFMALVLGIILGYIYFSNLTRDIYIMRKSLEDIRKGDFNKIQSVNRNDELGDLSKGLIFMSNTIEENIKELRVETDYLNKAIDKLKKMDKEQKVFIGNVTHEFKTPITNIKAYADVIGMYENDLNLIEEGTINISKECDRLTSMVDRVLNLSVLEKYDFEIRKKEVNLKGCFDEICERMMSKIKKNNLTLNCKIENIIFLIDEESLRHILINLIDNAIKYNKVNGNIDIQCYKKDNMINIIIKDTGIGIPEKDLSKIFEPFYRVESHRSKETGGVGLGLALVKKLVGKQQGTIEVESVLN